MVTIGVVIALYLIISVAIGVYTKGKIKTEDDFLAAGGKMGVLVGGLALSAAQMSVGTSIGTVGFQNAFGYNFSWIWIFIWIAWTVNAFWIGPRLKKFYEKTGSLTVPEFVAVRYESNFARSMSALFLLIAFALTIVAELVGIGTIFSVAMGIPPVYTIIVTAVVFIVYTMFGGQFSVVYTSVFQMIIFLAGFVIAAGFALYRVGGLVRMNEALAEIDPSLVAEGMPIGTVMASGLSFGFMMIGYPLVAQRFFSIRDGKTIRDACGIVIITQAIMATCVAIMGVSSRVLFNLSSPDDASATIAVELLPALLGGLLLAAILASAQSTASGVLLMIGSAVSHDIVKTQFRPNMDQKQVLSLSRICLAVIGLAVIPIAFLELPLIQQIWINAAAIIGSTFAIALLFGVCWKRGNSLGGTLSIALGFLCSTIWMLAGNPFGVSCIYLGIGGSLLGMIVGSLATPPPSEKTVKIFFE